MQSTSYTDDKKKLEVTALFNSKASQAEQKKYQEKFDQEPQVVMTTKITPGTDGVEKQSKSLGNYIALEDTPRDKFGKIMSLPDFLIVPYLEVYTLVPIEEIESIKKEMEEGKNPMEAKKVLAVSLVERYHGKEIATDEKSWFERAFSKREIPEDIPEVKVGKELDFMGVLKVCMPEESKSSIVRLVKQEAVRLNGKKVLMEKELPKLKSGDILKVGKRRWFKIVF